MKGTSLLLFLNEGSSKVSVWGALFCQLTFTCSKPTVETLEKGVKYVQS